MRSSEELNLLFVTGRASICCYFSALISAKFSSNFFFRVAAAAIASKINSFIFFLLSNCFVVCIYFTILIKDSQYWAKFLLAMIKWKKKGREGSQSERRVTGKNRKMANKSRNQERRKTGKNGNGQSTNKLINQQPKRSNENDR